MDLLDKVKDGITKGIDTIGTKSKELVEGAQDRLQLSSLRDKRQKAVESLGEMAFELFQKGAFSDPEAKELCESIAELDGQIAVKQAELKHEPQAAAAGQALVKCDCGAQNAAGVNFCSSCGKKTS